jgi:hypothetical protein
VYRDIEMEIHSFSILVFYKIATMITGLALCYMGYRLFLFDKDRNSGNLEITHDKSSIKLYSAAPGIFFSLFGTIIICVSIFKGVGYKLERVDPDNLKGPEIVIPESLPRS